MRRLFMLALIAGLPGAALAQQPAGDAAKGEQIFKTCGICHDIGPTAKIKVGPPLNGVVGRPWGSWPEFSYSQGLKDGKTKGNVWTVEMLEKWLENPRALVPGTKMIFPGLKTAEQRADVIAYLSQFDEKGNKK
ncbi:MAG: c-type cytochrome [Pseudolabrys sp.]